LVAGPWSPAEPTLSGDRPPNSGRRRYRWWPGPLGEPAVKPQHKRIDGRPDRSADDHSTVRVPLSIDLPPGARLDDCATCAAKRMATENPWGR
jgi:hypothetical protein